MSIPGTKKRGLWSTQRGTGNRVKNASAVRHRLSSHPTNPDGSQQVPFEGANTSSRRAGLATSLESDKGNIREH